MLPLRAGPLAEELARELGPADDAAGELAADAIREARAPPAAQPAATEADPGPPALPSFERVSGRRLAVLPFGSSADDSPNTKTQDEESRGANALEPATGATGPTPLAAPIAPPAPAEVTSGPIGLEDATTEYAPQPVYPRRAVEQRLEGEVTLLALVKADGTVGACEVETSSGHALLDDAAKIALVKWRFKPRLRDGELRPFTARVPFRFFIPR